MSLAHTVFKIMYFAVITITSSRISRMLTYGYKFIATHSCPTWPSLPGLETASDSLLSSSLSQSSSDLLNFSRR